MAGSSSFYSGRGRRSYRPYRYSGFTGNPSVRKFSSFRPYSYKARFNGNAGWHQGYGKGSFSRNRSFNGQGAPKGGPVVKKVMIPVVKQVSVVFTAEEAVLLICCVLKDGGPTVDVISPGETRGRLCCVTGRGLVSNGGSSQRSRAKIFFHGISEKVNYELEGSSPFIHRRVVFVANRAVNVAAVTVRGEHEVRFKSIDWDNWPIDLQDWLFGGQSALDVHNELLTPLNAQNVREISDEKFFLIRMELARLHLRSSGIGLIRIWFMKERMVKAVGLLVLLIWGMCTCWIYLLVGETVTKGVVGFLLLLRWRYIGERFDAEVRLLRFHYDLILALVSGYIPLLSFRLLY